MLRSIVLRVDLLRWWGLFFGRWMNCCPSGTARIRSDPIPDNLIFQLDAYTMNQTGGCGYMAWLLLACRLVYDRCITFGQQEWLDRQGTGRHPLPSVPLVSSGFKPAKCGAEWVARTKINKFHRAPPHGNGQHHRRVRLRYWVSPTPHPPQFLPHLPPSRALFFVSFFYDTRRFTFHAQEPRRAP